MEKENHINDMQQLAETGWKQMHEMLRQKGLSVDANELAPARKKWNFFQLLIAFVFFILTLSFPYLLNDKHFLNNKFSSSSSFRSNTEAPSTKEQTGNFQSQKVVAPVGQSPLISNKKNILAVTPKAVVDNSEEESFFSIQFQKEEHLLKSSLEKIPLASLLKPEFKSDSVLSITASGFLSGNEKMKEEVSKKPQFFAGAGINIASGNKHSNSFFDGFNIHPGFSIVVPLTKKLGLHSGLYAFSTVHGKEISAKDKEIVNNSSGNLYYNINTTTIVKASYFDVPVTLHYSINKDWSVGSGLQLSRLYKINIREQKESFDYNNTLFSATVDQFSTTPARIAGAFQRKVEINKYEPRFIAETNLQQGKWLFSAGYYYGLGKSVTLKETDNTRHQYRNEYFKLGVQYRVF